MKRSRARKRKNGRSRTRTCSRLRIEAGRVKTWRKSEQDEART